MTEPRADLHNHTSYSDGEYTPDDLLARAAELGLAAVAVTDHDTIDALPEALAAGKALGVDVVCGVEVTVRFVEDFFRGSLHLLVYLPPELLERDDFMHETGELLALGRGQALNIARLQALNAHFGPGGVEPLLAEPLEERHLLEHGTRISRRHFALALSQRGFDKATITRMIGNDSPAYVPSGMAIEALADYLPRWPRLVRVLAHPAAGSFPEESHYKEVNPRWDVIERLLPRFLDLGLDGLEAVYPAHTPEWEQRVRDEAARLGLPLATGGSDCHDPEMRPLGKCSVPMAVVEQIREIQAGRA